MSEIKEVSGPSVQMTAAAPIAAIVQDSDGSDTVSMCLLDVDIGGGKQLRQLVVAPPCPNRASCL